MILVDVQVPALDRVYDFELDEESQTGRLAEEIAALIVGWEKLPESGAMDLYGVRQETFLRRDETLKGQGVGDGDRLILI